MKKDITIQPLRTDVLVAYRNPTSARVQVTARLADLFRRRIPSTATRSSETTFLESQL
jgi:hypothetical protein